MDVSINHYMHNIQSKPRLLAFAHTPVCTPRSNHALHMTAGHVDGKDATKSSMHPPKPPTHTASNRIENRPEVVGGLPLWITMGLADQLRRFTEMLSIAPSATLRRNTVAKLGEKVTQTKDHSAEASLPVGPTLRKIGDVMEEELKSLQNSLATMRAELMSSRKEVEFVRKKLAEFKKRGETQKKVDSERALSQTATQLQMLYMKEQTRAAAAEKKLQNALVRLEVAERKSRLLEQDIVKLSVLYAGVAVVLIGFLMELPLWPSILSYLGKTGH